MDFDSWFTKSWARATAELEVAPVEDELPEGIAEGPDGVYFVDCCVCDRRCELPVGLDEIPKTGYQHYGNCGPSCCP